MIQRRGVFTRSKRSVRDASAVFACASLLTGLLAGYAQAPSRTRAHVAAQTNSSAPSEGQRIFEDSCAGCHGLDGRGGERGPDICSRQQVVQLSDGDTLEVLRRGIPTAGMPPFASLGAAKLNAVLAYLRSLQGKGASAALPGDPKNGKALFFGKARCSECHMVSGAGGFLGQDLTLYGANLSAKEIHSNIANPSEGSGHSNKTAVATMRDTQTFRGIIRNQDNFSVQLQSFDGAFHLLKKSDVNKLEFLPDPIMPSDYGTTLTATEIDDLVSYLMTAARGPGSGAKRSREDEAE